MSFCNPYSNLGTSCPKGGVKIHESPSSSVKPNTLGAVSQEDFYNHLKAQNRHTGVRVDNSLNNAYKEDPFGNINPFENPEGVNAWKKKSAVIESNDFYKLDLNIDNYSVDDLFNLFGIREKTMLTEDILKESKKVVLKTHPDKSKLDAKYFLFFSAAYKKLFGIWEFQNKSKNASMASSKVVEGNSNGFGDLPKERKEALHSFFDKNKALQKGGDFNKWFNEQFDKYRYEDETDKAGYGDWLKSNDGVENDFNNVSQANMGREMENYKKKVQSVVEYKGVHDMAPTFGAGGALLASSSNFGSSSLFSSEGLGYTDLRQAYTESVIPVTQEDYERMPKDRYRNVEAYRRERDSIDTTPLEKKEAMRLLFKQNEELESYSAAVAHYQARQFERNQEKQNEFWSSMLHLKN